MAATCQLEAVFLDRDGTIGGTGYFVHPRDFQPYPYTEKAIRLLHAAGVKVFAFTNQTHIAYGEVGQDELVREFEALGFDGAYICPHLPEDRCGCRKPLPGLLLRAAREHDLNLTRTAVIGDTGATDMVAADAVGAIKILVRTGLGEGSLNEFRHTWADVEPDYVAADLLDAVEWLIAKLG
ncbi:MAG: HAD-IIIA family hydrolase [Bacillota bacterium]